MFYSVFGVAVNVNLNLTFKRTVTVRRTYFDTRYKLKVYRK